MKTTLTQISFTREWLTGPLAGLTVRDSLMVDKKRAVQASLDMQGITKQNPGTEVITHFKFWIYNVGSEDVAR